MAHSPTADQPLKDVPVPATWPRSGWLRAAGTIAVLLFIAILGFTLVTPSMNGLCSAIVPGGENNFRLDLNRFGLLIAGGLYIVLGIIVGVVSTVLAARELSPRAAIVCALGALVWITAIVAGVMQSSTVTVERCLEWWTQHTPY